MEAQSNTNNKVFDKLQKKYEVILKKWGKNLQKQSFSVDKQTIYDIFANKLNVDAETIKNKSTIKPKGVIGF